MTKHIKRKLYIVTFHNGNEMDWDLTTSNADTIEEVEDDFVEWFQKDNSEGGYNITLERKDVEAYPITEVDGYNVLLETPKRK